MRFIRVTINPELQGNLVITELSCELSKQLGLQLALDFN
jgi:hypothetical protein